MSKQPLKPDFNTLPTGDAVYWHPAIKEWRKEWMDTYAINSKRTLFRWNQDGRHSSWIEVFWDEDRLVQGVLFDDN